MIYLFYYLLFHCVGSENCSSRYREIVPLWPVIVFFLPYNSPAAGALHLYRPHLRYIEDDGVKIIGLYGVRGVGKSTLIKQLNDMFSDMSHKFGAVIMVKASTELNIGKIQEVIRSRFRD